jgi:hypothetical protein
MRKQLGQQSNRSSRVLEWDVSAEINSVQYVTKGAILPFKFCEADGFTLLRSI